MFLTSKLRASPSEINTCLRSNRERRGLKPIDLRIPLRCAYCQANVQMPFSRLVDGAWRHDCTVRLPGEPDNPTPAFFNSMAKRGG